MWMRVRRFVPYFLAAELANPASGAPALTLNEIAEPRIEPWVTIIKQRTTYQRTYSKPAQA